MARVAGVNIPNEKRVVIALTYIYGIGPAHAKNIVEAAKVDASIRAKDLTDDQINALRKEIDDHYKIEGDLKRELLTNVKRLKEIGSYRGSRHSKNLPVRGQRTKTNSRTVRGNTRKTAGSGKKAAAQKT